MKKVFLILFTIFMTSCAGWHFTTKNFIKVKVKGKEYTCRLNSSYKDKSGSVHCLIPVKDIVYDCKVDFSKDNANLNVDEECSIVSAP